MFPGKVSIGYKADDRVGLLYVADGARTQMRIDVGFMLWSDAACWCLCGALLLCCGWWMLRKPGVVRFEVRAR